MYSCDITETEKVAIAKFRLQIEDLIDASAISVEDHFLIRWLRARNLDLAKGEQMLRNYITWRNENSLLKKSITFNPSSYLLDNLPFKFTGFDHEGRVVLFIPFGRWELRNVLEAGLKDDCFKLQYQLLDSLQAKIEEQRKLHGVNQFVVVGDSAELTFRKLANYETIQSILKFFREFESYYPELLHSAYILNTPTVFTYIFNIVKPLLSSHTLSKVKLFDYNEERWKCAIGGEIPCSSIPIEYGGAGERMWG